MYIFGKNVAKEVLKENTKIKKVIVAKNFSDEEIMKQLKRNY